MGQTLDKEKKEELEFFKNPWRYWFPLRGPSISGNATKRNVKFSTKLDERKTYKSTEKDGPIRPKRKVRFVYLNMSEV